MTYFVEVSGRAFGPFPVATIKGWIDSGRVTAETRASTNKLEWKRADEFPELAPFFGVSVGAPGGAADADAAVWFLSMDRQTVFGPYRGSDVLQWIRDGRVKGDTLVWREGENSREISTEPYFALQFNAPSGGGGVGGFGASGGGADQAAAAAVRPSAEPQEWYYSVDGIQGRGPYSITEILEFVEQGRASVDSVVWRQGENARKMRSEPAFKARLERVNAGLNPNMYMTPAMQQMAALEAIELTPLAPMERVKRNGQLRFRYRWIWITSIVSIIAAVALIAAIAVIIVRELEPSDDIFLGLHAVNVVGFLSSVSSIFNTAAWVFIWMFLFSFWKSIPDNIARVSPGYAVGFLFIPFFQLYWIFIAFIGGANDMNKAFKLYQRVGAQLGEKAKFVSKGAAIMLSLLLFLLPAFLLVLPILLRLYGVPSFMQGAIYFTIASLIGPVLCVTTILFAAFFTSFKNAAIQLNNWRAGSLDENDRRIGNTVTLDDLVNS